MDGLSSVFPLVQLLLRGSSVFGKEAGGTQNSPDLDHCRKKEGKKRSAISEQIELYFPFKIIQHMTKVNIKLLQLQSRRYMFNPQP